MIYLIYIIYLSNKMSKPSEVATLNTILPPELITDTRKTDFAMVLVFIPFVGKQMTWPRPFTPCARCRVTKTYDIYCTPCDKYLWMEIG